MTTYSLELCIRNPFPVFPISYIEKKQGHLGVKTGHEQAIYRAYKKAYECKQLYMRCGNDVFFCQLVYTRTYTLCGEIDPEGA